MQKQWRDPDIAQACERVWNAQGSMTAGPDANHIMRELEPYGGSDSDKLRWFAIWLEENVIPGWPVINRLYADAVDRDPVDPRLRISWALAAYNYADFGPTSDRSSMLHEAARLGEDAVQVAPGDADAHYILGLALYANEMHPITDAEREFRCASKLRPDFASARLYLAHALEDLGRWDEALVEMEAVSEEKLLTEMGGEQLWRVAKLREHMAVCLLRLGRITQAERAVGEFLELVEQSAPNDLQAPERLLEFSALLPGPLVARLRKVVNGDHKEPENPARVPDRG